MTSEHPLSSIDMSLPDMNRCISGSELNVFESPMSQTSSDSSTFPIPIESYSVPRDSPSEAKLGRDKKVTPRSRSSPSKKSSTRCTCEYCISQHKKEGPSKAHSSVPPLNLQTVTPDILLNKQSKSPNKRDKKKPPKQARSFSMVLVSDPDVADSVLHKEQKEQEELLYRRSVVESLLPPSGTELELKDFYPQESHSQVSDDGGSTEAGSNSSNTSSPAMVTHLPPLPWFRGGASDSDDEDSSDLCDVIVWDRTTTPSKYVPLNRKVLHGQADSRRLDGCVSLTTRFWTWWSRRMEVCWDRNLEHCGNAHGILTANEVDSEWTTSLEKELSRLQKDLAYRQHQQQ